MDVNAINQLLGGANTSPTGTPPQQTTPPPTASPPDFGPAGVYEPGKQEPESNQLRPDLNRVKEMWDSHQQQVDSFRRMIETLINRQAQESGLAMGTWQPQQPLAMEVTDEMRDAAKAQVEEGGYFSVDETASRILDFAVAISGGDPSKIDLLRRSVERGFAAAERAWGGELPEISQQTFNAVMNGFDEWQEAGSAKAISLLNKEPA